MKTEIIKNLSNTSFEKTAVKFYYSLTANEKSTLKDCIIIGTGHADLHRNAIMLNNKAEKKESVSQLVYNASTKRVEEWKSVLRTMKEPFYVLEDLSPDTCFSLLLFQLRVIEESSIYSEDELLKEWVEYCNRWESGDMITTGVPFHSWGCLHNALSHHFFEGRREKVLDEAKFRLGFLHCLQFLRTLLENEASPYHVPALPFSKEYQKAKNLIKQEHNQYKQSLKQAELLQLELPMNNSAKSLLVDAILSVDYRMLGAQKVFLRNDEEHAWMKAGFGLMAVHQPRAIGTGNDMVISVEPTLEINLEKLWFELEKLENEKWAGKRPSNFPRYKDDSRTNANEPWYDENGRYTLIAAPRRINDSLLGTKLTWNDVMEALWRVYHPLQHFYVDNINSKGALEEKGKSYLPHDIAPVIKQEEKHLITMKWSTTNLNPMVLSPTVIRYLAACANAKRNKGFPLLADLPTEKTFDLLEIPGGIVVIHENGVLLLDDWSKENSNVSVYRQEFEHAYERYEVITKLYDDVKKEINSFWEIINHKTKRIGAKELIQLNKRMTLLKLFLRKTILNTMIKTSEINVQLYREKLEKRWGISRKMDELYNAVSELEQIIKGHSEVHTNQLINGITIYGFPLILFSSLLQFLFSGISSLLWLTIGLTSIIFASLLCILGIRFILWWSNKGTNRLRDEGRGRGIYDE